MLAPPMATVPVQLIVYWSSFSRPGRYGITPSRLRLYSVVRRGLDFTLPAGPPSRKRGWAFPLAARLCPQAPYPLSI
jgi:hypothetical protein